MDFSNLVVAPNMTVFAKSITVTPTRSQPTANPYAGRGIFALQSQSIVTEGGGIVSTYSMTCSIRLSEYVFAPTQGDWITVLASDLPLAMWEGEVFPNDTIDFEIDSFTPDGQGAAKLVLARVIPE